MALEGTLKDFALPDIFQLIGLQKKTGMLILKNENDEVTIGFKDGMLVSADSKKRRLEDRLGTMLVRGELITEGQLQDVLEKQKQTLQRVGVLLVNEGLVRKEALRKALEQQVTQIIYRVFRWEDAYYRFDQDAPIDYDRENFTPMGAESVLMEGMRIVDEWPIVEKVVRSTHLIYEKVPVNQPIDIEGARPEQDDDDFDFDLGAAKASSKADHGDKILLSRQEGSVYQFLDGRRTVEDVMYLAQLSEFDTCKALYDLLNRDLIREKSSTSPAGSATLAASARPAEMSPVVIWLCYGVLAALVVAGAVFYRKVPLPFNTRHPAGVTEADVERQANAAIGTRLDKVVHALESHRLAQGGDQYAGNLEDLVESGYLRSADLRNPWDEPFDYTPLGDGDGFRLQAFDAEGNSPPELSRESGGARR